MLHLLRLLLAAWLVALPPLAAPAVDRQAGEADGPPTPRRVTAAGSNDRLGIDHISYGDGLRSAQRYRFAREAGAGWNRWVFYWHDIEKVPGGFDYTTQDATVRADRAEGLKVLGLLFGTPRWALEEQETRVARLGGEPPLPRVGQKGYPEEVRLKAARTQQIVNSVLPPRGLHSPVFADGTDTPAPGKAINQQNLWARFVQRTAQQYRGNVHAWEIWNEPDFPPTEETGWFGFWAGGVENYARILKVAYLSIRSVDPSVPVVMGGMAFWLQPEFFPRLLGVLTRDPIARTHGHFFTATAWHWYTRPSYLYERTLWVREELARAGIPEKAIWVTETNVPVCGDPAVSIRVDCLPGHHRGTLEHQASFVFQAIAYGFLAGVERIFFFQLFDDDVGGGEYYGLVRNNGTPRPAHGALRTAATYFAGIASPYRTLNQGGTVEMITFFSGPAQRLRAIWNAGPRATAVDVPVGGSPLQVVDDVGTARSANASPGTLFSLGLPPATLNDNPDPPPEYVIGGRPFLLVESNAPRGNGAIEGTVRDAAGRGAAGVQVQIGERKVPTDAAGRYRVEVPPGLYDGAVLTIVPLSEPVYSIPVWAGRSTTRDHHLRPLRQNFIPITALGGSFRGR